MLTEYDLRQIERTIDSDTSTLDDLRDAAERLLEALREAQERVSEHENRREG